LLLEKLLGQRSVCQRAEDEASLGAWNRSKVAWLQLDFLMSLLFCFPPTPVPGSAALIPGLGAVTVRTNAICDLSPSENNPVSALSPYLTTHEEGKCRAKASSHPKLLSDSMCSSVRSSIGTDCMRRKRLKHVFYQQNRISFFRRL